MLSIKIVENIGKLFGLGSFIELQRWWVREARRGGPDDSQPSVKPSAKSKEIENAILVSILTVRTRLRAFP